MLPPPEANLVSLLFFITFICIRTWLLDMINHRYITRTYLRVGGMLASLCTCSHVLCYAPHSFFCMIVHTANIFHATLLMSSLHDYCRRSIREVRRQNGRKITIGTQTLDKCWDYCKDLIPIKNKLLNAEIWNYVYQWQWRYHHRHALWQMVPKALKELCA